MARKRPKREERRTLLLVTNGKRTEHTYLTALKSLAREQPLAIKVQHIDGEPQTLLKKLQSPHGDTSAYDEVWLVVDEDGVDREPILDGCVKACTRNQTWTAVISRPCFEVWLIGHYAQVRRYQNQDDAIAHFDELAGARPTPKHLPRDFPYEGIGDARARSHLVGTLPAPVTRLPPSPGTAMPHLIAALGLG